MAGSEAVVKAFQEAGGHPSQLQGAVWAERPTIHAMFDYLEIPVHQRAQFAVSLVGGDYIPESEWGVDRPFMSKEAFIIHLASERRIDAIRDSDDPGAVLPMASTRAFVDWLMRLLHLSNAWLREILYTFVAEINPVEDVGFMFMSQKRFGASHRNPDLAKLGQTITRVAMVAAAVAVTIITAANGMDFVPSLKIILLAVVAVEKGVHLLLNVAKLIVDWVNLRRQTRQAEQIELNRLADRLDGLGSRVPVGRILAGASVFFFMLAATFHIAHGDPNITANAARFGAVFAISA